MDFPAVEPVRRGESSTGIGPGDLLDAVAAFTLVLDLEGRIVFANRATEQASGLSSADLAGRPIAELAPEFGELGGEAQAFRTTWPSEHGAEGVVQWTRTPIIKSGEVRLFLCTGLDLTEQHRAKHALRDQLDFLQTLIDRIPNPIFFKSADGRYLGCNEAFSRFLAVPRDRIVGRTVYEVSPPELADLYYRRDKELLDNPGLQIYEAAVRTSSGEVRNVIFYKATYPDSSGRVAGLIGVILDITERKRAEQGLQEARNQLEQRVKERTAELERLKDVAEAADRAKSEFLDIASHELRTPLTPLLMSVQRARRRLAQGTPIERSTLDGMERHIHRLVRLAKELLDVSRLERGRITLDRTPTDLRSLASEVVEDFRKVAPSRRIKLHRPRAPVLVDVDRVRIQQVLSELIDNAVKYTPADTPIEVTIRADAFRATAEVTDRGPGIPPEEQQALFDRFFRRDRLMQQAGMGLGLYLAREVTLAHGGDIEVESRRGMTTFSVHLPLQAT